MLILILGSILNIIIIIFCFVLFQDREYNEITSTVITCTFSIIEAAGSRRKVWLKVISLAVGNEDILTYQSLSAVSKQMRALVQSLPKPTPSIQLSEDVCAILSICPFAFEVVLSYDRLKQAAGLFSSLSKRLTELLPRLQPEKTLLVIHGNHFFGQQDFILQAFYTVNMRRQM